MHSAKKNLVDISDEIQADVDKVGIEPSVFKTAIEEGVRAFMREGESSAKSASGYNAWNSILKTLRHETKLAKWGENFYNNGVEGIVSHLKKIVVIVNSGDSSTGIEDEVPRPKNQKGSGYDGFMRGNLELINSGLDLFENNSIVADSIDPNQTWIFLYYIDEKNGQVRYELSLPTNILNKTIGGWKKRIIFSPFDISDTPKVTSNGDKKEESNEIDFDVIRKNG